MTSLFPDLFWIHIYNRSEGFDRPTLDMPGVQNELISRLGKTNTNTVAVLQSVGI